MVGAPRARRRLGPPLRQAFEDDRGRDHRAEGTGALTRGRARVTRGPIHRLSHPDPSAPLPPARRFSVWREELRRAWHELRGRQTTPWNAAASVALGLFIGSIPIFGCHTPLVIGLSVWFGLDGAIAWLVSNVSNPLFAPALLTAEVQLGAWLRTGAPLHIDEELSRAGAAAHFVGYMLLGSPLAGLVLAVAGGTVAYAGVALAPRRRRREPYRLPDDAPPWFHAVERVATRFAAPTSPTPRERTRFHYLRGKLVADPAARLIVDLAADTPQGLGDVLDVGTGRGQIPLLLLELGSASNAVGVDWDERKIADAQRAARGEGVGRLDAIFTRSDLRDAVFAPADTVLLIDVLHYFTIAEQDALLGRVAAAVRPGGQLLLREADGARGWRSAVTLVEERLFTWLRHNRGDHVVFRPAADIAARLEAAGLTCSTRPAWGATPFSNVLIVARRPRRPVE